MGYCRACRPDRYPSGPRQGEHHFAVRLGDAFLPLWVYLDGELVKWCTEVLAGNPGLVVCEHDGPVRRCPCGSLGPAEEIRRGLVEVTSRKREE